MFFRHLLRRLRCAQEEGRHLKLQFQFRFTRDSEEVLFAFCFPHSYEDCERDLERCEDQVGAWVRGWSRRGEGGQRNKMDLRAS